MVLVDPIDKSSLEKSGTRLRSASGRAYQIVNGIPVMLHRDMGETIALAGWTRDAVERGDDAYFTSTIGISPEQRVMLRSTIASGSFVIDPVVQYLVAATNGRLYRGVVGNLPRYPIPELRLPEGRGTSFLDIGCSWGRWAIAAARKSYSVTAIDPSLGALLAGQRVSEELGLKISFVCADARYLPFPSGSFDTAFSYSVLQHFARDDVAAALSEIGRVLAPLASSVVQMPNRFGLISLLHQSRRLFRDGRGFEVRYWSPQQLLRAFRKGVGDSAFTIDGFFGLGIQSADRDLIPRRYRAIVRMSDFLRQRAPWLMPVADSLYVHSIKH